MCNIQCMIELLIEFISLNLLYYFTGFIVMKPSHIIKFISYRYVVICRNTIIYQQIIIINDDEERERADYYADPSAAAPIDVE